MFTVWINDNDKTNVQMIYIFFQFAKNITYHERNMPSPYEVLFGVKPKGNIALSSLPANQIVNIEVKEQLEGIVTIFEKKIESHQKSYSKEKYRREAATKRFHTNP